MLSGFKQFILRGNVVDMAVGVVIGAPLRRGQGADGRLVDAVHRSDRGKPDFPPFISRLTVSVSCGPFHQRPGGVVLVPQPSISLS